MCPVCTHMLGVAHNSKVWVFAVRTPCHTIKSNKISLLWFASKFWKMSFLARNREFWNSADHFFSEICLFSNKIQKTLCNLEKSLFGKVFGWFSKLGDHPEKTLCIFKCTHKAQKSALFCACWQHFVFSCNVICCRIEKNALNLSGDS